MHQTIFHTPIVKTLLRWGSKLYLRLTGWRILGDFAQANQKCVVIAAPHTSNWDLPLTLMAAFEWQMHAYWLGKQSIFKFPFGPVMRWLGGIAVDRSKSNNLVSASAQAIVDADGPVHLLVPPEGTRGKSRVWKTGFYYIALEAQVPIVMAYMDYAKKEVGISELFVPSGDVDADMVRIKAFYAGVKGKNPDQFEAAPS